MGLGCRGLGSILTTETNRQMDEQNLFSYRFLKSSTTAQSENWKSVTLAFSFPPQITASYFEIPEYHQYWYPFPQSEPSISKLDTPRMALPHPIWCVPCDSPPQWGWQMSSPEITQLPWPGWALPFLIILTVCGGADLGLPPHRNNALKY